MTDFRDLVHDFFHEVWDPAHVDGVPGAEDEYQAFEGAFVACARQGYFTDRAALVAFVEDTEEAMGGDATPERVQEIAEGLAALVAGDLHGSLHGGTDPA